MIKRSIKNFIASDGQPMVVLIDENRIPLFHPNIYAMTKFRTLGRQVSTTEKISTALAWPTCGQLFIILTWNIQF